jgi:hypothetical protein
MIEHFPATIDRGLSPPVSARRMRRPGERASLTRIQGGGKWKSFETIYRIPSSHILKTKFHSYGGGVPDSWSHVEYDDRGQFVARYESRPTSEERSKITLDVDVIWDCLRSGGQAAIAACG